VSYIVGKVFEGDGAFGFRSPARRGFRSVARAVLISGGIDYGDHGVFPEETSPLRPWCIRVPLLTCGRRARVRGHGSARAEGWLSENLWRGPKRPWGKALKRGNLREFGQMKEKIRWVGGAFSRSSIPCIEAVEVLERSMIQTPSIAAGSNQLAASKLPGHSIATRCRGKNGGVWLGPAPRSRAPQTRGAREGR